MRIAYADPPYIGYSRYYKDDPNCAEVDHQELIKKMCNEFDGWALSLYTNSLKEILEMCPNDVRVGAWIKPYAVFKPGVNPAYAWEPVIFWGGRKRKREEDTIRDWIALNSTRKKGLIGEKPIKLGYWIFEMLGAKKGDKFVDLFPGTGVIGRAWENYINKTRYDIGLLEYA